MSNAPVILNAPWDRIIELVATYPSPHNSQPLWIKPVSDEQAEIYFDLRRGLPAESFGIAFGFVTIGIFLELLKIAAHGLAYEVNEEINYSDMDYSGELGLKKIGVVTLHKQQKPVADLDLELITERQTSRLNYENRVVDAAAIGEIKKEAAAYGQTWTDETRKEIVDAVIAVNQRTLFYDMENPAVRHEIGMWLRYSRTEAAKKKDGLAAECMNVSGLLLRAFVKLHFLWGLPLLSTFAQKSYLATMQGVTQIGWLKTKFETNQDYVKSGRAFIRLWLIFTKHGVAIHPFGSVITNQRAHKEFCDIVGEHEKGEMAWMLLRIGYSEKPPKSMRRDLSELVLA